MRMPQIIPVTDLRQDAAAVLRKLQSSPDPLVITQRGRAAAVLMSIYAYERSRRERELFRLLALGEKDIGASRGRSLASVLKEADSFLDEQGS